MEEGVLPHTTTVLATQSDCFMDLDYMDQYLLEGCWLEATGSEFSNFDTSTPISPFEPSFIWPTTLESIHDESGGNQSKDSREDRQKSSFPENLSISKSQGPPQLQCKNSQSHMENIANSLAQSENYMIEQSKRWWIGPRAATSVMDRLVRALGYIKDCSRDENVLIQVWVPVNRGGNCFLTTNQQPFSLDLNCPRLTQYREISVNYHFPAEEDSKDVVGLPGRVFRSKVPEWTPDVRFFTRDEYPRVGHAQQYDVKGTLAVPVLEQGSQSCLGVIEVVLTSQKIKYRPELDNVCKALEAVDLKSSERTNTEDVKITDLSYQAALPEILKVLQIACRTHGLPLAQTWVQCILQGKGGCRHSEENLKSCVSPVEAACYIGDPSILGFHEACTEYHLLKDQGIVGRAFKTNEPCFMPDVTACSKTEYPLSHHARMFGLRAAVAIRLRSTCTGSSDFVLEFFLPVKCTVPQEQEVLLNSLSMIIQNVCRTLRVVTDEELQGEVIKVEEKMHILRPYSSGVPLFQKGKSREKLVECSEVQSGQPVSNSTEPVTFVKIPSTSCDGSSNYTNKSGEKRRIKAEKTITLQVLRQHFAGSLKDAAKNLGVCPTTLKRICRQHGIQRWPSRKIKKVGHSLQKIQRVIDSVQGTSGVLQIDSFYSNFPELASPNGSRTTQFSNSKSNDHLPPLDGLPESGILSPQAAASLSPSSCSQSSSSSQCYSSGTNQTTTSTVVKEEPDKGILKRATSDASLHFSCNGEPKRLPRSHSHVSMYVPKGKSVNEQPTKENGQKPIDRDAPRIKVTFGEDTIRFRMQSRWRYTDLLEEISRRFGINDGSGFHLKYLDDDLEWVLLTCDADLEECIDVCRSSRSQTIKLCLLRDSQPPFGIRRGTI